MSSPSVRQSMARPRSAAAADASSASRDRRPAAAGRAAARRPIASSTLPSSDRRGERLLELVADGVVVLGGVADLLLEPVGDALVEVGPVVLEQASVGGVADEHVVEPQDGLVDPVRPRRFDQLLLAQSFEGGVEPWLHVGRDDARHRPPVERLAEHRRRLQDRALVVGEAVDAGAEQRRGS